MAAGQHLAVAVEANALDEGGALSNLDTFARLFDASGNQLASNDNEANPYTGAYSADSALSFVASATATYYVGVSASGNSSYDPNTAGSGIGGGTGAYRLELLLSNNAPLAAPMWPSATASGPGRINVSWSAVAAATGYTLQRSANGATGWSTIASVASSATSYSDTGLSPGTAHAYRIQASNADSISPYSIQAGATTAPAAPSGLTAVPVSAAQINLSWANAPSNVYYTYVEQSTDGANWTQLAMIYGAATSYTATGPFNGSATYEFRVRDYGLSGGYSDYSPVISVTAPAWPGTPTLASAVTQSASAIALSWTDVAGETGFRVERSANSGFNWAAAGTVSAGVTSFTDIGLSEATSYTYRVFATNSAGDSAPSTTRTATTQPSAPSDLTATAISGSQINLTWTDHSTAASSYYVEQSSDGTNWSQIAMIYGSATHGYTATGPFNGSTAYEFRVRDSGYGGGYSAYSSVVSVTTPAFPNPPTLTSALAQSDSAIALAWSDVAGETGFRIERQASGTWTVVGTVTAGVASFTDAGLLEATSYTYRVVATSSAGDSAPSATRTATALPSAPTGLTASVVSWNQINLTWTDHSTAASSYYVEESTDGANWSQIGTIYGPSATSYTVAGPFNGSSTYKFRVRDSGYGGGYSAYSPVVSVTTPAFLNQPTLISAAAQSDNSIALSWSDVVGETGFRIERQASGTWTVVGTVTAGVASFTDAGLLEATSYTYRVVATNSAGDSAPSATRTAVTQPSAPSDLTATAISGSQINLSWTDHSTVAAYYDIEKSSDATHWTRITSIFGSPSNSYTANGPFNGSTTYIFRVRAYSYLGGYSAYVTASVTTAFPNAPMLTSAAAQSDTSIALAWSDVANEKGFRVERLMSGTPMAAWALGMGVTSFTDTGLSEATMYSYQVFATNDAGDSAPITGLYVTTLLSPPTGLMAAVDSTTRINLSWTDHSAEADFYIIEQSADGATWMRVGTVDGNADGCTVYGSFNSAATYNFRVHAYAYSGNTSTYATTSAATASPNAPTLTSATAQSDTAIALHWSDVAGETGFRVERMMSGTWTTVGAVAAGVTSFTDTGLSEATSYSYRIVATKATGGSAFSASASAMTCPAEPTNLIANVGSAELVNLRWSDQSAGETGYWIQQATSLQGPWTAAGTVGANVTSATLGGPFNGNTTYYFRVHAYDASGDSAPAMTMLTTPGFPDAPSGLKVTLLSTTSVDLNWDNDPAADSYKVFRRTGNGAWTEIGTVAAGVTAFTDTSIVAGMIYVYGVAAVNGPDMSGRATVGPALARDGSEDADEDGLTNLQEANLGTDPTYFDTDGDLLPDGWEASYSGFDPKSPNPAQGDADDDGLTNFDEYKRGTNPDLSDTDGDGVSDADEVNSGADPTDPGDGGKAPADDSKAKFQLTVGDPSGSQSERWELQVGDVRYQSPNYGVVGSESYFFNAGETYEIRMKHVGTDPTYLAQFGGPNYDWTAGVTEVGNSLPYWIDDQGDLLRTYISDVIGPPNLVDGKTSYLYIPQLDVDVDSDNNNGFDLPDRTDEEDRLEGGTGGAKILTADTGDVDGDGVPDYADFDGIEGRKFVPIVISLSSNLQYADPSKIEYTFTYDASDATAPLRSGSGAADDPYVYTRPSGSLRIWKKDASQSRDPNADFIESGQEISAEDLGLEPGGSLTLYVEAVAGSTSYLPVEVSAKVTGDKWSGTLKDNVDFASTETRFVRVNPDGSPSNQANIELSSPAPAFSDVTISIDPTSLHPRSDGSDLLGTVVISGTLKDAALNLVAGVDGTIGYVAVYVNGSDQPVAIIQTSVTKGSDYSSILAPYEFSATFTATLPNVALQEGWDLIHLSTSDVYGFSGFAEATIEVLETPDSSGDPTNYTGYTFSVGASSGINASGPGDFNPFLVEILGPAELIDAIQQVTVGGRTYELASYGPGTARYLAAQDAPGVPHAFMAAQSPLLSTPPTTPAPANALAETVSFAQGFGAGLLDTGAEWWDGIRSVARFGWHYVKNYTVTYYYRLAIGENGILVEDQMAVSAAWEQAEALAKTASQILNDEGNLLLDALGGNVQAINRLGEQYTVAFQLVGELLQSVKDELLNMSAYDAGRITGRIVGEAVMLVGSSVATVGVGAAVKSTMLPKLVTKLESVSYIPPAIINKIETTAIRLITALQRTKMCFVAGTSVHTGRGLVAIEDIRPGDLVLSRDAETGEQAHKPVLETFVTRPDRLIHVHFRAEDGRTGVLTGTREHPFHVIGADRFVPAGELKVGDVLSLAGATRATVSGLAEETTSPDRPFTTYNFEVADFHTYFVGEVGVWVHNAGEGLCQKIFSMYNGIMLEHGLQDQPWAAFKILLEETTGARWWIKAAFGDTIDEVMGQVYAQAIDPTTGKVNLSAVPTVKEVYEAIGATWNGTFWAGSRFGKGLGDYGLEVHHTAVSQWASVLLNRPLTQAELDNMPALLLRKVNHGGKKGSGAFHATLRELMPDGSTTDRDEILDNLQEAYTKFGQPEVWLVARQWLTNMGVQ